MVKNQSIDQLPLLIAQDVLKAKQLLNGYTSTLEISRRVNVNHATIYRLRHHERSFGSLTINTCWKLANYPSIKPLDYTKLDELINQVIQYTHNIAALSRRTHISRITLQRLSEHVNNPKKTNIMIVLKLVKLWSNIQKETVDSVKA